MADPATIVFAVKTAVAAASDERTRTAMLSVVMAVLMPFLLVILVIVGIASGGAENNQTAVDIVFDGDVPGSNLPDDYRQYIREMQECFEKLDEVLNEISAVTEGDTVDAVLVKSVFYAMFFGREHLKPEDGYYRDFADCFVVYEERRRPVIDESSGGMTEEIYEAAIAIKDMTKIYENIKSLGETVTYENQSNADEIYYYVTHGVPAPSEGDSFQEWSSWSPESGTDFYELPAGENGNVIVEYASQRLGDPYSQELRGKGNYTDCSYLSMWCYAQAGIRIPGTAAEQARYCVENKLTVSRKNLQPGDLVFWSYKPNARFMNVGHVGIYAGDGMVIDASCSKGKVVYRKLFDADKQVLYGRPSVK